MCTTGLDRYLNAASIARSALPIARNERRSIEVSPNGSELQPINGVDFFFAHNATLAAVHLVNYYIFYKNYTVDPDIGTTNTHPVIVNALPRVIHRTPMGKIRIITLMHWITGKMLLDALRCNSTNASDELLIIDAVQAFGNLSSTELQQIIDCAQHNVVIVGGVHKWLGCPIPLGFMLLPSDMLQSDEGLSDYLAARDYLGDSICRRTSYPAFPDTYSAKLSPIFATYLRIALGQDIGTSMDIFQTINNNRKFISECFKSSTRFYVYGKDDDCRGMMAIQADTSIATQVSERLQQHGFTHTVFHASPEFGLSTLRLSAPVVPMDEDTKISFRAVVKSII